jgi:conjugal transfer pilus assembly protein TrbC
MKTAYLRALLFSVLTCCTPFSGASEPAELTSHDKAWITSQEKAFSAFKNTLGEQTVTLPAAQNDLISRLQGEIAAQQSGQAERGTFPAIYFVSLGIPREGLLPMLQDARRFSIPATIRGLLNNDMRRTAAAIFELSKEDKAVGVQIDPTLYSDYHIGVVPALVVTCPGHYDVIRGSLPLEEALEKVARSGDCAATARQILAGGSK